MKAAERSFLNASDLCSIEISKTKTFHPLGNVTKTLHPILKLKKLGVLKQLKTWAYTTF